jgi:hypothetical protein
MRTRLLLAIPVLGVLCLAGWSIVPRTTAVTCTNTAGVARTWTTTSGGVPFGGGGMSATRQVSNVSGTDKASYRPVTMSPAQQLALRQQVYVVDAIDQGLDPVTAARQFGPWTVPGATGAQLAHAMDPATYGWRCR